MKGGLLGVFLLALATTAAAPQAQLDELIARAKSLELDTPYLPPPGDPLVHHAAGYAKVMCSAVFMTGLAPDFAAENVGYFTAPYEMRAMLGKPVIDRANQAVHITLPNGVTRTAKYLGSQGCVTLPLGEGAVHFKPVVEMTLSEDRKVVAKNLWVILDAFERNGHGKKEAVLREANMGDERDSTKQLYYYTLPPFDTVSAALEKRIERLVKRTDRYRQLAEVAAKKAGWDKQEVLIELFKGSSYDTSERGSEPIPNLPDYLFKIDDILQRMKDWLVQNTRIEWYYQTLREEDVCDEWGNFIFGRHVSSQVDWSSNVPPTIWYGKAIPGIVLHRILGAELPVDFVPEPKFECRTDDDIPPGMDAEPPSNLPVEHLKFRRYFEIRLGLAPVGASGEIGLVFDQRRVDELWNETKCRTYVPIWFWPQSNFKDSSWKIFDVYDRLPPPVGVLFAHFDYTAEVGGGWLRFKADVDESTPPYELWVDANNPDVSSEEYASRVGQDQRVEEVNAWTCKKYLSQSQKIGASYGSTAVESPLGTPAARIEENLYSADERDRFDTLLKEEVEHRCSLLEDCRQQRRRLIDENKRRLYSRWESDE
jgi:hypothetical protein